MKVEHVKSIAREQFNDALIWLGSVSRQEPPLGSPIPLELKIMRGLFFVQLYGTVERVVQDTMLNLMLEIKALSPRGIDIDKKFYVVSMANKWKSLKDKGYRDVFTQMKDFFLEEESPEVCALDENIFALYLQNIKAKTVEEIFLSVGIDFTLPMLDKLLINEIVDNRNKIAHGRESAAHVGSGYTTDALRNKLTQTQAFLFQFIDTIEAFFDKREFIKVSERVKYI